MTDLMAMGVGGMLIAAGVLTWFRCRAVSPSITEEEPDVFAGISAEPQPVFSEAALSLYNLIKLAVEDRYLVFVQVPVWLLVRVNAVDPAVRVRLLRKLAFRRVDVALVHPGTRMVQQVVLIDGEAAGAEARRRRDQLVGTLLDVAGIQIVRLDATQPHTLAGLRHALGLESSEETSDG